MLFIHLKQEEEYQGAKDHFETSDLLQLIDQDLQQDFDERSIDENNFQEDMI